jgi:valyl-tRNA synthetase
MQPEPANDQDYDVYIELLKEKIHDTTTSQAEHKDFTQYLTVLQAIEKLLPTMPPSIASEYKQINEKFIEGMDTNMK